MKKFNNYLLSIYEEIKKDYIKFYFFIFFITLLSLAIIFFIRNTNNINENKQINKQEEIIHKEISYGPNIKNGDNFVFDNKNFIEIKSKNGDDFILEALIGVGYINNLGIINYGIEPGKKTIRDDIIEKQLELINNLCKGKMNFGDISEKELNNFFEEYYKTFNKEYFLESEKFILLKNILDINCKISHIESKKYIYNNFVNFFFIKNNINIKDENFIYNSSTTKNYKEISKLINDNVFLNNFLELTKSDSITGGNEKAKNMEIKGIRIK